MKSYSQWCGSGGIKLGEKQSFTNKNTSFFPQEITFFKAISNGLGTDLFSFFTFNRCCEIIDLVILITWIRIHQILLIRIQSIRIHITGYSDWHCLPCRSGAGWRRDVWIARQIKSFVRNTRSDKGSRKKTVFF